MRHGPPPAVPCGSRSRTLVSYAIICAISRSCFCCMISSRLRSCRAGGRSRSADGGAPGRACTTYLAQHLQLIVVEPRAAARAAAALAVRGRRHRCHLVDRLSRQQRLQLVRHALGWRGRGNELGALRRRARQRGLDGLTLLLTLLQLLCGRVGGAGRRVRRPSRGPARSHPCASARSAGAASRQTRAPCPAP